MPQRDNSFTKAFLPGLILGIVVGGFAGAYLTGAGGETIQPKAVNGQPAPQRPRDAMEAPPANEQVPVIDQGAAPANNPANNPANPPANNAFASATLKEGSAWTATGTNADATDEPNEPLTTLSDNPHG